MEIRLVISGRAYNLTVEVGLSDNDPTVIDATRLAFIAAEGEQAALNVNWAGMTVARPATGGLLVSAKPEYGEAG